MDDEKGLGGKLEGEDKETISAAVKETLEWLDDNQTADAEEYKAKLKELEKTANPIVAKAVGGQRGAGGAGAASDEDFGHEEL